MDSGFRIYCRRRIFGPCSLMQIIRNNAICLFFLGDKWALSVGIFLSMWCVSRGVRESSDIYVFVRSTLPDFVAGHERCRWRCLFSLLGIGKRGGGGSAKQCVGGGIQAFPLLRVRPCGRESDSREKLTTEPARANPPASNRAIWQPFSGSIWNSRATRAAPVVCPVSRAVASIPLALPLRSGGAEAIRMLLLGDWNRPESEAAEQESPDDVGDVGVARAESRPEPGPPPWMKRSYAAHGSCVDPFDQQAGDRSHDHNDSGPGSGGSGPYVLLYIRMSFAGRREARP